MLQVLLDAGANTERRNTQGETILTTAIKFGDLECVRLFVEYGANVNACSENGMPCLSFALARKQYSIVAYLLEQDSCEVGVCGTNGYCLLQLLVLANDASLISILKSRRVNLNTHCPVRSRLLFLIQSDFIGWHCCFVLRNKALQEQGTEGTVGQWS